MTLATMLSKGDAEVATDLKPVSTVTVTLSSNATIEIPCTLMPEDLMKVWNNPFRKTIKFCGGDNSYVCIKKKNVAILWVKPKA